MGYRRPNHNTWRNVLGTLVVVYVASGGIAPVAEAVTNTVAYTGATAVSPTTSPTAESPSQLGFRASLQVGTDPTGQQPNAVSDFTFFFPSAVVAHGPSIPSCAQTDIDGRQQIPASCRDATIGYGTATMLAGSSGAASSNSIVESLDVRAVNGSAGSQILLVVNSQPDAPVAITNRVMPGTVTGESSPFGFSVHFQVPADLQNQLGLDITLTNLTLTFPGTQRVLNGAGLARSGSFLEISDCSAPLPIRAIVAFTSAAGPVSPVESDGTVGCEAGTFDDPYPPSSQSLPAPQPGKTANVAPATPCDSPTGPPGSGGNCQSLCPPSGCKTLIKLPGSTNFVALGADGQIPVGATIDVTAGAVRLTTAGAGAKPQSGIFYGGVFTLLQSRRDPTTELRLTSIRNRACGNVARTSRKPSKAKRNSLWSNVHGSFRSRGKYAAATALGTKWQIVDRCDGTQVNVREGRVSVRDFPRRRVLVLRKGGSYLARPKRA